METDIDRLVEILESGDVLAHEAEARELAERIEGTVQAAVKKAAGPHAMMVWQGGDLLVNKWVVWNLCSDLHTAVALA